MQSDLSAFRESGNLAYGGRLRCGHEDVYFVAVAGFVHRQLPAVLAVPFVAEAVLFGAADGAVNFPDDRQLPVEMPTVDAAILS